MIPFEGTVEQFANKAKSFNFKIGGKKFSFVGNNVSGVGNGDFVTGTYKETPGQDKATGKTFTWNEIVSINKSAVTQSSPGTTTQAATKAYHKEHNSDFVFPVPATGNYQRSVIRRECLAVAQANLGQGADYKKVLKLTKLFEAYCAGDIEAPAAEDDIAF